ncbi:heat shock cognate 70 kDa protein-like [Silene latifolia]|uniref:heat shock cognate 70 kDa protein-like n=1 Tax=Silene latifolia TaxID=37657 RepID=UPI003D782398
MADKAVGHWPAVGIDLGTTYSCVAVWQDDRVEIITNDLGNRTTPSCVAFIEHQRLIGEGAINKATINPTNTIYDAKRLIGRQFNDQVVQDDMKLWPFTVIAQEVENGNKKPMIVVNYKDEEKHFFPEEISSMILSKMKDIATAYLGTEVKNLFVVFIPTYFNNAQPYGLDKKLTSGEVETAKNVLVFDLGGGTFDVSLVAIGKDAFEVKAVSGDFDQRMVNYFIAEFERKHNKNMSDNPRALGRLRAACERAKRNLSSTPETSIDIDCLFDGIDFSTTITRARFEKLNMDLFQNCLEPIDKCLKDAKIKKSEVHEIVLVGGSTRTPMVRRLVQDFFNGKELCQGINPDEAVAYGAACHAAVLTGTMGLKNHVLVDVTPLSLGIELYYGDMKVIVPRNTTIPTKRNGRVSTAYDNQLSASFPVYEGEKPVAVENHYLGQFVLEGIPPAPQGVPKFDTVFEIDADEAKRYKVNEEAFKEAAVAKNTLENYVDEVKKKARVNMWKIDLKDKRKIDDVIEQTEQWLDWNNIFGKARMFDQKIQRLVKISEPIFMKMRTSDDTEIEVLELD